MMALKDWRAEPEPSWIRARFRDCVLDRNRRELTRDGFRQALEPRVFDVLVYLIEHRGRVVTKQDIAVRCLRKTAVNRGAVARAIMLIRQAISDFDPSSPLVSTMHSVGYRFVGRVELDASVQAAMTPVRPENHLDDLQPDTRLALLPFRNDTGDEELAWIELGLVSLLGKAFQSLPGVSVIAVQDVLMALGNLTPRSTLEQRLQAVEARLGTHTVGWASLGGRYGRFVLNFGLKTPTEDARFSSVAGADAAKMALEAAERMREWLSLGTSPRAAELDLGDSFLNETYARALQRVRQNRLLEAEHLLDVVRESGAHGPDVQFEAAKLAVLLGRPGALDQLQSLEQDAPEDDSAYLCAMRHWLRGVHLEQQGQMAEAADATRKAYELADAHGLQDLAVQCMVACSAQLGACFDERAPALLSRTIPRAERLGNSVLVLQAYTTAGRLAGYRNDWISAAHHHGMAVSIARLMDETVQAAPYGHLASARTQLGQLGSAVESAITAFRKAQASGQQPDLGHAAGAAARACLADRRIHATIELYRTMCGLESDQSVALTLAREVHCRATLLQVTRHFDAALACIAAASEASQDHPVFRARCDSAKLFVLLQARRFDELEAACMAMREGIAKGRDPRLGPWIEGALALREYLAFGHAGVALDSLRAIARQTPVCEAHARASLEAAWIHLERDEFEAANAMVAHLPTWLEQSPPGVLVNARMRYMAGDYHGAAVIQRHFEERYGESLTHYQHHLLELYEHSEADGQHRSIPVLHESLNLHWGIVPALLAELPRSLGGLEGAPNA